MDHMESADIISEAYICTIIKPIIDSIRFCHEYSIVHRDLKPENILFQGHGFSTVKLADFGLARIVGDELMTTACGTPAYMAPEILMGLPYTSAVDYWSVGVILFLLLSGKLPFEGDRVEDSIVNREPDFTGPSWKAISEEAKDLCRRLLAKRAEDRIGLGDVLTHPWILRDGMFGSTIKELGEKLCYYNLYKKLASSKRTTVGEIRIAKIRQRLNSIMEIE